MTDDRLTGVEALARWNHPKLGLLGAAALFAAAERPAYLLPLSSHIQQRALEIASPWPDKLAHIRLAINVTDSDITQANLLDSFMKRLEESCIHIHRVTIAIPTTSRSAELD